MLTNSCYFEAEILTAPISFKRQYQIDYSLFWMFQWQVLCVGCQHCGEIFEKFPARWITDVSGGAMLSCSYLLLTFKSSYHPIQKYTCKTINPVKTLLFLNFGFIFILNVKLTKRKRSLVSFIPPILQLIFNPVFFLKPQTRFEFCHVALNCMPFESFRYSILLYFHR